VKHNRQTGLVTQESKHLSPTWTQIGFFAMDRYRDERHVRYCRHSWARINLYDYFYYTRSSEGEMIDTRSIDTHSNIVEERVSCGRMTKPNGVCFQFSFNRAFSGRAIQHYEITYIPSPRSLLYLPQCRPAAIRVFAVVVARGDSAGHGA
jgi:hypothetical protein